MESDLRYCNLFLSKYHSDVWTGNIYLDLPELEQKQQKLWSQLTYEIGFEKSDVEKAAYIQTNLNALGQCIATLKERANDAFAQFQKSHPELTYDQAVVEWISKQKQPINIEEQMKENVAKFTTQYAASEPYMRRFLNWLKPLIGIYQAQNVQKSFHEKSLQEQREISNRLKVFLQNPTIQSLGIILGLLGTPWLLSVLSSHLKQRQMVLNFSIINFTRERENVDLVMDALRVEMKAVKTGERVILWKNRRFRVYYMAVKLSMLEFLISGMQRKIEKILNATLPNIPHDISLKRSLTKGVVDATIELGEGPVVRLALPAPPPQPPAPTKVKEAKVKEAKVKSRQLECDNGDNYPDLMHAFGDLSDDEGNVIPKKATTTFCMQAICGLGIRNSKDYRKKIAELRKKHPDQQSFEQDDMVRLLNSCKNEDAYCTRAPEKKSSPIIHITHAGSTQCYTRKQLLEMLQSPALWYDPDNIPVYLLAPFNVYVRADKTFRNNLVKNRINYELVDRKRERLHDESNTLDKVGVVYTVRVH